jgi:UDP-N-acetylmuramoyl-tripeptide--D-alanyl-D-alanine ligase
LIFQPFTVLIRSQIIQKAKKRRESLKNLIVIGITGSYGKTSTKEFLATILSEKYKVLKTKEHQNSEVGISQCILNDLKPEHEIFIVEMGAYNRGGIKLLCDITKPKIGILTGINEQHMATFGSQENIIKTKYELIESLPKDGLAVFNGNNKYCLELYQKTNLTKKIIFHTMHTNSTIVKNVCNGELCAENIKVEKEFIYFKAFSRDGGFADFKLNLIGAQNIENLLMAICCAKELGMNLKEIAKACEKIKPEQGGMKLIKTKKGLNIIDSTYSANPDGVMAHLDYLKIWEGKKVIVMPCLIELGKASIDIHKKIGEGIGQVCDLAIITTKERFKEIEEAVFAKATASQRKTEIIFMEDPKEIVERIKTFCQPGDVVILEGRIPKEIHKFLTEKL